MDTLNVSLIFFFCRTVENIDGQLKSLHLESNNACKITHCVTDHFVNHHDTNIFKVNSEKWRGQPYFKHLLFSYLNLSVFS